MLRLLRRCTVPQFTRSATTKREPGKGKAANPDVFKPPRARRGTRVAVHPTKEQGIVFDHKEHTYTLLPSGRTLAGVTSLLRTPLLQPGCSERAPVVPAFDAEGVAEQVASAQGSTAAAVLRSWEDTRDLGTWLHDHAYHKLTAKRVTAPRPKLPDAKRHKQNCKAFNAFLTKLREHGYKLMPGGSEMIVWSEELGVAGTIDCVMHCADGNELCSEPHHIILDWKTGSAHLQQISGVERLGWPLSHLPNSKLHRYSVQLNMYKRLLMGAWVKGPVLMALVHFRMGEFGVVTDFLTVEDLGPPADELLRAASASVNA